MALLIIGLLFINFMFFILIGIGGVSMASVEGVASPWLHKLLFLWVCFHIPFGFYIMNLVKNKKNEKKLIAIKRSIALSAWLVFPGAIGLFILIGSKIVWMSAVIPFIQTIIAVVVYLKNK